MNPYIEKLKDYFENQPIGNQEDAKSVLELLHYIYTDLNPIHNAVIKYQFREMSSVLDKLTLEENDRISNLTADVCTEYSRQAFLKGVHIGFCLAEELYH